MTGKIQILSGLILCGAVMASPGGPAGPGAGATADLPVTLSEATIKLPGITINRETLEVRIEATVCLDSGILEYVVCQPNTHEHEAIFVTKANPELLHAALLLSGLKPMPQLPGLIDLWWEKALKQKNSRVGIEVEWEVNGAMKRTNLTSMLRNREGRKNKVEGAEPAKVKDVQDAWVFAGSYMHTDKESGTRTYAAHLHGVLVGIWANRSTVIQYGIESGNPYQGEGLGMEVNEERVPEKGTKVTLVFSQYAPPQESPPGK